MGNGRNSYGAYRGEWENEVLADVSVEYIVERKEGVALRDPLGQQLQRHV